MFCNNEVFAILVNTKSNLMADEKNKNVDPEEENDNQFDDDEDFGLPDLDYDELDDDEDSDLEEEPDFIEPEEEPEAAPLASTPSDKVSGEDELDEDVEINVEDIDASETEDWEKELEKELEEELKAEEAGGFYEEESYADFEASGDEESINESVFSGDDTGFEDSDDTHDDSAYTTSTAAATGAAAGSAYHNTGTTSKTSYVSQYDTDSNSKGKFTKTVIIGTIAFAVIAIVLWLAWGGGEEAQPKKPVAQKVEKKAPPPAVKETPKETQPVEQKPAPQEKQTAQPNNTTPGEITVLSQRTGKSYVVIGSFFDGDMANDYAKELADEGKSPLVIPPFKDYRFYRVAIAEFDNFKDAQASVDTYQNEYGQEVWPLRY